LHKNNHTPVFLYTNYTHEHFLWILLITTRRLAITLATRRARFLRQIFEQARVRVQASEKRLVGAAIVVAALVELLMDSFAQ
jgi:hypothetical protein